MLRLTSFRLLLKFTCINQLALFITQAFGSFSPDPHSAQFHVFPYFCLYVLHFTLCASSFHSVLDSVFCTFEYNNKITVSWIHTEQKPALTLLCLHLCPRNDFFSIVSGTHTKTTTFSRCLSHTITHKHQSVSAIIACEKGGGCEKDSDQKFNVGVTEKWAGV